jgi:hypothetical protein
MSKAVWDTARRFARTSQQRASVQEQHHVRCLDCGPDHKTPIAAVAVMPYHVYFFRCISLLGPRGHLGTGPTSALLFLTFLPSFPLPHIKLTERHCKPPHHGRIRPLPHHTRLVTIPPIIASPTQQAATALRPKSRRHRQQAGTFASSRRSAGARPPSSVLITKRPCSCCCHAIPRVHTFFDVSPCWDHEVALKPDRRPLCCFSFSFRFSSPHIKLSKRHCKHPHHSRVSLLLRYTTLTSPPIIASPRTYC